MCPVPTILIIRRMIKDYDGAVKPKSSDFMGRVGGLEVIFPLENGNLEESWVGQSVMLSLPSPVSPSFVKIIRTQNTRRTETTGNLRGGSS
jgi:hypothetical protein